MAVLFTILFLHLFFKIYYGQLLNEEFKYCDDISLNKILDPNINCNNVRKSMRINESKTNLSIWIMFKNDYVINDFGYQCNKKKLFLYLNESILFEKSERLIKQDILLTPVECWAMIESKKCENKPMICDDEGCTFNEIPNGEYSWFSNHVYYGYECSYQKKLIVSKNMNKSIFSNSLNKCFPTNLYCQIKNSIIVWPKDIIINSPFFLIQQGKNFTQFNNIFYSTTDNILFQIDSYEFIYNLKIYSTLEGLFFYIINAKDSFNDLQNLTKLPFKPALKKFITQNSLDKLLLSEIDFESFSLNNRLDNIDKSTLYSNCILFKNQLFNLLNFDDSFQTIYDLDGNKLFVYVYSGSLFVPECTHIDYIFINELVECYQDIPVTIKSQNKTFNVFLTKNNILKSKSQKINCNYLNDRHLLPSKRQAIVRYGKAISIVEVKGLNIETFILKRSNSTIYNFHHSEQIIRGSEYANRFDLLSSTNDLDNQYETVPNDITDKTSNLVLIMSGTKNFFENTLDNIKYGVLFSMPGLLVFALFLYLFCKK